MVARLTKQPKPLKLFVPGPDFRRLSRFFGLEIEFEACDEYFCASRSSRELLDETVSLPVKNFFNHYNGLFLT